jgi:predicted DCC family thiol-disulfide oxidoreductase YuxK
MINVYYDDRCPLCSREIEYYKKISTPAIINWCGISQHTCTLEKHGVSYLESLKVLHSINAEGKIYRGVDSFILIWQQLARWKWLALFVSLPVIYHVTKVLYGIFAHSRFNSLDHCVIEKNNPHSHDNHI